MRYFSRPEQDLYEAALLSERFGKHYTPYGPVNFGLDARLDNPGIELIDLEGQTLAIHPDSSAWAFVSPGEAALLRDLAGRPFRWLAQALGPAAEPMATHLFRRGLITINGQTAVDPTILKDSPNTDEAHLVEILVTEKCNLACTYCLAGAGPDMPVISPKLARRTIDLAFAMEEARGIGFEFSGGEPLTQFPLLRELVSYIQEHPRRGNRPVYLMLQTNGTLLDEERVEWLRDNSIQVGVSLDGNPHAHNRSRPLLGGKASFPMLMRGLDLLQRFSVHFGAIVVLNRSNVSSVEDLVDFLLDNGIESFKLNPVSFLGDARTTWGEVGLQDHEIISYFQQFLRIISARGHHLQEANIRSMLDFLTSKQRRTRCLRTHCGAGDTFQAIAASGDIYPCGRATQTPELRMGNVGDEGLKSLSYAGGGHPVIQQIRQRRPDDLEGCALCPYRQLCQAGCSVQSLEKYGTVRHRTPECSFFKTLYPYLMRWLSFDVPAFQALNASGYFGSGAVLIARDYMEEAVKNNTDTGIRE